jgi:hypothetical protein
METTIIDGLAQYGPLGLWTASLLFMNWQQRKDKLADEKAAKEAMAYHQEKSCDGFVKPNPHDSSNNG